MKLLPLTDYTDSFSCFLLDLDGCRILLDCGGNIEPPIPCGNCQCISIRTPIFACVDFSTVDAILISNHCSITSLPFITEYSTFKGKIFATDPTKHLGALLMEELLYSVPKYGFTHYSAVNNHSDGKNVFGDQRTHRALYTKQDIDNCISRIISVHYNETIEIPSCGRVMPLRSGFCVGSCNWVIYGKYSQVAYVSSSSIAAASRHPCPIDYTYLMKSDVMVISDLNPESSPETTADFLIGNICRNVLETIDKRGNVIIPAAPVGYTFELIEHIHRQLQQSGCTSVPIYLVSPVAQNMIDYIRKATEWTSNSTECALDFIRLKDCGELRSMESIASNSSHKIEEPCVMFVSHPSLMFGDSTQLLQMWGRNKSNMIIFIDPNVNAKKALEPFLPLEIKVLCCPLDYRLSCQDTNRLVSQCNPKKIMIPRELLDDSNNDSSSHTTIKPLHQDDRGGSTIPYSVLNESVDICDVSCCAAMIASDLSNEVKVGIVGDNAVGRINARARKQAATSLSAESILLEELFPSPPHQESHDGKGNLAITRLHSYPKIVWGVYEPRSLEKQLKKRGFRDIASSYDEATEETVLSIPSIGASISCKKDATNIVVEEEEHRVTLRNAVLSNLSEI